MCVCGERDGVAFRFFFFPFFSGFTGGWAPNWGLFPFPLLWVLPICPQIPLFKGLEGGEPPLARCFLSANYFFFNFFFFFLVFAISNNYFLPRSFFYTKRFPFSIKTFSPLLSIFFPKKKMSAFFGFCGLIYKVPFFFSIHFKIPNFFS